MKKEIKIEFRVPYMHDAVRVQEMVRFLEANAKGIKIQNDSSWKVIVLTFREV